MHEKLLFTLSTTLAPVLTNTTWKIYIIQEQF